MVESTKQKPAVDFLSQSEPEDTGNDDAMIALAYKKAQEL